jgi:dethiobiotin synthetase
MEYWPCLLLLVPFVGLLSIWIKKLRLPILLVVVFWLGIIVGVHITAAAYRSATIDAR